KIIARKTKDQQKTADALLSVVKVNTDIAIQRKEMNLAAYKMKNQALIDIMKQDIDIDNQRNELTIQQIENSKQRAGVIASKYSNAMIPACMSKVQAAFISVCGGNLPDGTYSPWGKCGAKDVRQFLGAKQGIAAELAPIIANQSVYINKDGDVKTKEEEAVKINKELTSITGAVEGYERIYCVDLPNYESAIVAPVKADLNAIYDFLLRMNCGGSSNGNFKLELSTFDLKDTFQYKYTQVVQTAHSENCGKDCGSSWTDVTPVERNMNDVYIYKFRNMYVNSKGICTNIYTAQTSNAGGNFASTKEVPNTDLAAEHLGRGEEVFNTVILPAMNINGSAKASVPAVKPAAAEAAAGDKK
ncbi:MAG: hypothetical protein LBH41_00910, partial [Rickettsiales bacterium]|nr:hypothetical protein [Rickettsiales bacterium]